MQNFSHFEKKKRQIYREETTETKSNRKQKELGLSDRSIWNLTFGFGHQSNQSINSRKPLQQIKKKSGQIMTREKFCGYLFRVMSRESAINWLMKCDLIPNNSTTLNCSTVCHCRGLSGGCLCSLSTDDHQHRQRHFRSIGFYSFTEIWWQKRNFSDGQRREENVGGNGYQNSIWTQLTTPRSHLLIRNFIFITIDGNDLLQL
jgi:hypothetical protein